MDPERDDQLHGLFENRRQEDEKITPAFDRLWRRATDSPPKRRGVGTLVAWRLTVVSAVLAIVVMLLWPGRMRQLPRSGGELQLSEWKAPTDFLLQTPGRELLDRTPEIPSARGREVLQMLPDVSPGGRQTEGKKQ